MKEDISVPPVFKIAIFLLILKNAQGDTQQGYDESRRNYYDYSSPDSRSSASRNGDTASLRIAWTRPIKQNAIKITRRPSGSPTKNENDRLPNDKFIFPNLDIVGNRDHQTFVPRMEEVSACRGKTFCEDVPSYPTKHVDELIRSQNLEPVENVDAVDIDYRIGTIPTESLCSFTETTLFLKAGQDVNDQWFYIVNTPNYTQGIRAEICLHEGEECRLVGAVPVGYVTTCVQKYVYRPLTAVITNDSMSTKLFRLPSSCCCHVQFIGSLSRFKTDRSVDS